MSITVDIFALGPLETNCYVLRSYQQCWVIDPGIGVWPVLQHLKQANLTPTRILLTHGHGDHIAGCDEMRKEWPGLKVACSAADAPMLTDPVLNVSALFGLPLQVAAADEFIEPGQTLQLGAAQVHVLDTSGHSPGGLSFYVPSIRAVFTGDALMDGGVGRTDMPGCSEQKLLDNIRKHLLTLPDDTRVFGGHGNSSTIGLEKVDNPYL